MAVSNASTSQCSTIGGQSLSITVPHAYVSKACRDIFTDAALIPLTPTSAALTTALNVTFRKEDYWVSPNLTDAGVPLTATKDMTQRLRAIQESLQETA